MRPGTHMSRPQVCDQADIAPGEVKLQRPGSGGLKRDPIKIPVATRRGSRVWP